MTDLVQNITVRYNREVTAMPEAPKEPSRPVHFAASSWPAPYSNWERVVAVESSLEFACAKISL